MDVSVEVIILPWDRRPPISLHLILGITGFKHSAIGEGGIGAELVPWSLSGSSHTRTHTQLEKQKSANQYIDTHNFGAFHYKVIPLLPPTTETARPLQAIHAFFTRSDHLHCEKRGMENSVRASFMLGISVSRGAYSETS
ncbi:uncharacterized protein [Physcomitrium patens]|uniref:uncharacterized protein n=1 Tax=Physcomitrium patens TaxID=3218 RepID=UPI00024AE33E